MIRIGIVGFGKLGKSVKKAIERTNDMELVGVFSRREVEACYKLEEILDFKDKIDLLILCGSSDHDILEQGPELIKDFNTLDSFDNHSKIKEYYKKMNQLAKDNDRLALVSTGWDPGLFSLMRGISQSILAEGKTYTLWGKGVSQGHSAAVRSIEGVLDASQYTIPKESVLQMIRSGQDFNFDSHMAHLREVYVVANEDYDKKKIEEEIKSMPDYFEGYETIVHFIRQEELEKNHKTMEHGGHVIRFGKASGSSKARIEFSLDLENNPDFTAAVDVAYARALYRLYKDGKRGAMTVFDIAPKYIYDKTYDELLGLV